ncbi:MAG: 5'-nucleotidase C-terminal domain-containing protein [Spirochaetales bacterium]|nr:5'-nucleotidase C-terminal domain-containing protein [Spirochaetales bacterium]
MRKKITLLISVLIMVLMFAGCASTSNEQQETAAVEHHITILHTNDHHGHPVAFYNYPAAGQGGLPAQATLVEQIRAEVPNVLLLSAGDMNTGRPESNFFKAEPDVIGMNYIGYDAMAMGNHEFDPTPEEMQRQIVLCEFPWLCANVVKEDSGDYIDNVKPYIIKEYDGFKVAVFGLMTQTTESTGSPEHIKGYKFLDEVETANKLVPELKEQADIVIALVHCGIYDDVTKGSERIAAQVPGLALVVDGHSHTKVKEPIMVTNEETGKQVAVVQAKDWGLYMGRVDLSFLNGEVTDLKYQLIPINVKYQEKLDDGTKVYHFEGEELKEDEGLLALLQPYVDKVDSVLKEAIGTATAPFLNDNTRAEETAIGDLVADSLKWFAEQQGQEVDFAFQNGGGIRTSIADGEIQKQTVYEVLPFDNSVAVCTLKGSTVIEMFNATPANIGHGAMAQVSKGVSLTINSADGTVEELLINGSPVDPDAEYKVATNSYLAAGGDGYKMFNDKVDYYDTSLMQRDALIEYIISMGGTISPEVEGRITIK